MPPQKPAMPEAALARHAASAAEFRRWLAEQAAPTDPDRWAEGRKLLAKRREAMAWMIQHDPAAALEHALGYAERLQRVRGLLHLAQQVVVGDGATVTWLADPVEGNLIATTGGNVQLSLHAVFFKSLSILGSTMGSKGDLRQILRLFEQGRFVPTLDRTLPMAHVGEAHRLLEAREAMGKLALVP